MGATGYVYHPVFLEHDTGPAHPERPERLDAVHRCLGESGLLDELEVVEPEPANADELESVHDPAHVELIRRAAAAGPQRVDGETGVSTASFEAATRAAGAVVEAARRVNARDWKNAFCAVRPPGHHAERARAMGFCLFNNVAVAARALRADGVGRVAIVDWDVHHGNGTQHIFEEDPTVFYASLHQWPLYPGTGAAEERGRGAGEGTTLNCPLAPHTGEEEWLGALESRVLPALDAFRPEFVLVSAGFDAHRLDPLAQVELTEDAYREMTARLAELAERHAGGRLVSVLEGGYSLEALAASAEAHVGELLRRPPCV